MGDREPERTISVPPTRRSRKPAKKASEGPFERRVAGGITKTCAGEDMQHYVDRFYSAILVLVGDGHIKKRLVAAYADNIEGIDVSDLPAELKSDFLDLDDELHSVPPQSDEGAVCATVRKMSGEEASGCARRLLAMYAELLTWRDEQDDQLSVESPPLPLKSVG
jgi:hypothetical protein